MSEVLTQSPPANASEAPPAGAASSVSAAPADNVTLTNQNTAASLEKPANGTGWGVDLDKVNDPESLAKAIESLDLPPLPDENAPPAAPAPAAAPATPAAATSAPAPAADEALTRPGEMPKNFKIPVRNELDLKVYSMIKDARLNGHELSFAEAETRARESLGMPLPAAPAPAAAPAPSPAAATPPETPVSTPEPNAELAAAYAAYQAAREAFDAEAETKALVEINRLNRLQTQQELALQQQQSVEQAAAQELFNQQWEAALANAVAAFPDAANPDSALSQRAAEIQQVYAASTDPAQQAIYNSPNSALLYYQLAASELQVAPTATPAPQVPPVQKSTPQPVLGRQPPMAALLAGGHSGTPAPAAPGIDPLRMITNSHELDAFVESMAGKW